MKFRIYAFVTGITVATLAGCATGYSPPPERRADRNCPYGEVLVCTDYYPSRLETERDRELLCHCSPPTQIR